jgi:nucleotide-binding universal stress UspA family protein
MVTVLVPVRYPLSEHSQHTLSRAVETATERDGDLVVLHVDLYQNGDKIDRTELKRGIEREMGTLENVRYLVRRGFLVEETILEEIAAEDADVVVIGHKQLGRFRRTMRRLKRDPDIESYLRERVDCELLTVPPP